MKKISKLGIKKKIKLINYFKGRKLSEIYTIKMDELYFPFEVPFEEIEIQDVEDVFTYASATTLEFKEYLKRNFTDISEEYYSINI